MLGRNKKLKSHLANFNDLKSSSISQTVQNITSIHAFLLILQKEGMPTYFLDVSSRIPSEKLQISIGEPLLWT